MQKFLRKTEEGDDTIYIYTDMLFARGDMDIIMAKDVQSIPPRNVVELVDLNVPVIEDEDEEPGAESEKEVPEETEPEPDLILPKVPKPKSAVKKGTKKKFLVN